MLNVLDHFIPGKSVGQKSQQSVYTLYGSYASYATAKSRSYLRKKGIPFVERVPGTPRFREYVRKTSDNHRIPQIETPDGQVIQDSIEIFDTLEQQFPELPAYPPGIRQQMVARLFEFLIDATLGRSAWHYRWNYKDENYGFVGREFGRSFAPYGSDEELAHFGEVIAERMEGFRTSVFADSPDIWPLFDELYLDALEILEDHFQQYPYLFGGLPSIADHILMGPLFGHFGRDPVPSNIMKLKAPRVFRWTEHMNTPDIVSPEHHDTPAAYLADDVIPEGTMAFLRFCLDTHGAAIVESVEHYNDWAAYQSQKSSGELLSDKPKDHEPRITQFTTRIRNTAVQRTVSCNEIWVIQRVLDWMEALSDRDKESCHSLLVDCGGAIFCGLNLERRLTRVGTYMAFE
jgi:glutathione S-transferase